MCTPLCENCLTQWFEEKQQEIETLDMQLKKLYASVDTLVGNRKGRFLPEMLLCIEMYHQIVQIDYFVHIHKCHSVLIV